MCPAFCALWRVMTPCGQWPIPWCALACPQNQKLLLRTAWRAAFPQNGDPILALGIAQTRQNRVLGGWNAPGRWGFPRPGAFIGIQPRHSRFFANRQNGK
jgi:hypothetical protein